MIDGGLVSVYDIGGRVVYPSTVYVGGIFTSVSGVGVVCDCVICKVIIFSCIFRDEVICDDVIGA